MMDSEVQVVERGPKGLDFGNPKGKEGQKGVGREDIQQRPRSCSPQRQSHCQMRRARRRILLHEACWDFYSER